jgi:hypothetical protein
MVFNTTFNNISAISWWLFLLVEETGVPELTTLVVIDTDCIGSCKSNYHAITTICMNVRTSILLRLILFRVKKKIDYIYSTWPRYIVSCHTNFYFAVLPIWIHNKWYMERTLHWLIKRVEQTIKFYVSKIYALIPFLISI